MASKKSRANPYRWPNGTYHSRPFGKSHRDEPARGKTRTVTLKKAPPGSYDIGLDQAERASRRGLADLLDDLNQAGTRAVTDRGLSLADIGRQRTELGEDVTTQRQGVERDYGYTLSDLLSQQQGVERNYQSLANQQRQSLQASGLAEGGAALQAAQKRAANQTIEMQPIEVNRTRAGTARQLSLDDLLRQQTRGGQQLDRALGDVNLGYQRGVEDRSTQQTRAQREQQAYLGDLAQTRMQQYLQGGGRRKIKVGVKRYRKLKKRGVI